MPAGVALCTHGAVESSISISGIKRLTDFVGNYYANGLAAACYLFAQYSTMRQYAFLRLYYCYSE
jgi:hypothetical protein